MSKFLTKIPVDIDAVTGLFPAKSTVIEAKLSEDGKHVEIEWENDWRISPFTFSVEWSVAQLADNVMPEKVLTKEEFDAKLAENRKPNPAAQTPHPPILPNKPVDKLPVKVDKKAK